jgi:hypothetical protein
MFQTSWGGKHNFFSSSQECILGNKTPLGKGGGDTSVDDIGGGGGYKKGEKVKKKKSGRKGKNEKGEMVK